MNESFNNPFKVHQQLKPGISQLVTQTWNQHEKDRKLVSASTHQVQEALQSDWMADMNNFLNETFMTTIKMGDSPLVQEIFYCIAEGD